jgi:hypothetical protein
MKLSYIVASAVLAFAPAAFADQPNMEEALASLEAAKQSLQKATADKGGHRVKALKAVNEAIAEVKAGIEFSKQH